MLVGTQPTLLVIDDCIAERDLYEAALRQDFQIITASRGDDGLELAQHHRPDVVVLDVMMPGWNGWDTCKQFKSTPETAHIPIILLTGANDADLRAHAARVGADAILEKPCPADRLTAAIRQALAWGGDLRPAS